MLNWSEKYRPPSLNEIVGNRTAVDELKKWALSWEKGVPKKRAVILSGKPGTGKTATVRRFAFDNIVKTSKVRYVHVNCFINRTLFSVLRDISQQLNLPVPRRGFSSIELMELIVDMVRERNIYAIIVLDDVFHLVNHNGPDALGNLVKLSEEFINRGDVYRFGLILISQNLTFLEQLDKSVKSMLGATFIEFPPYTKDQIYEILLDRAKTALYDHAYSEDIIEMISDISGIEPNSKDEQRGDARYAIDVLWRAGKIAELNNASRIMPEHVREAVKSTLRGIRIDELKHLSIHMKIFLLAITKSLKRKSESAYVTFGEVEEMYHILCEQYGQVPRKHTQLWEYLKEFKERGIVETKLSGKGMRGRTTLISIPSEPLNTLETELENLISSEIYG